MENNKTIGEAITDTFFHHPLIDSLSVVGRASLENNWSDKVFEQYEINAGLNDEAASTWLQTLAILNILESAAVYTKEFKQWAAGGAYSITQRLMVE